IPRDEHMRKACQRTASSLASNPAACGEERIVRSGDGRDHCAKYGRSAKNRTGLKRRRATVERDAIAPEKLAIAKQLERLSQSACAETLAGRDPAKTGNVPADA